MMGSRMAMWKSQAIETLLLNFSDVLGKKALLSLKSPTVRCHQRLPHGLPHSRWRQHRAEHSQETVIKSKTGKKETQWKPVSRLPGERDTSGLQSHRLFAYPNLSSVSAICNGDGQYHAVVKPQSAETKVWVLVQPFSSYETLSKLHNLSVLQFSRQQNGGNNMGCWKQWVNSLCKALARVTAVLFMSNKCEL